MATQANARVLNILKALRATEAPAQPGPDEDGADETDDGEILENGGVPSKPGVDTATALLGDDNTQDVPEEPTDAARRSRARYGAYPRRRPQ